MLMKSINKFSLLMLFVALMSSFQARAQNSSEITTTMEEYQYRQSHYPSFMRFSVLGGLGLGVSSEGGSSDEKSRSGYSGSLFADFGRGLISFESGVQYFTLPTSLKVIDWSGASADRDVSVRMNYVALPAVLKFNYIEKPQAAFSIKAGILRAWLLSSQDEIATAMSDQGAATDELVSEDDTMIVAGFTGSAPLTENMAFLLDGTYLQGLTDLNEGGSRHKAILLSIGLRYSL